MARTFLASGMMAAVAIFATVTGLTIGITLAPGLGRAEQAAASACPTGPGVIATANNQKTLILPPTLRDSRGAGFSQGVRSGNLLFIAGQLGLGADLSFEAQTRRAFANLEAVLQTAGGSLHDLVWVNYFVVDESYIGQLIATRVDILGDDPPAGGGLITVSGLANPQALVEINGIAVLPCGGTA